MKAPISRYAPGRAGAPWLSRGKAPLLLVAALAAACRSESPAPPASGTAAPEEIVFCDWPEDMPQSVLEDFSREHGIAVRYETYGSQEEAVDLVGTGRKGCDVVVLEHDHFPPLIAAGKLAGIDFRNVPNFSNISLNFRNLATDPGNRHSVPYHFGTTGLVVRTDLVGRPPRRWADLLEPRFSGRIAIRNQFRELLGLTLLSLGHPINSEDPRHLEEALAWLLRLRQSSRIVDVEAASAVQPLVRGEAWILVGWAEDYRRTRESGAAVAYLLPEEGTDLWGDSYAIPASSRARAAAELLINHLLRPEVSARIVNEKAYANANEAALPLVRPEIRADLAVFPPPEVLRRAHVFGPLSPEGARRYAELSRRWEQGPVHRGEGT